MSDYGYAVEAPAGYDDVVIETRLALKAEGFSIVTEMHVGGLLGSDAGDDRQYLILGAWAAPAAQRPVDEGLRVAVHLPCNVVVQESGERAVVAALDPGEGIDEHDEASLEAADRARDALRRVLERVTGGQDA